MRCSKIPVTITTALMAVVFLLPAYAGQIEQKNHDKWLNSIVYIQTDGQAITGLVVGDKGEVVVEYYPHISKCKEAVAVFMGRGKDGKLHALESKVEIRAVDKTSNLALLLIEKGERQLTPVEIGSISNLRNEGPIAVLSVCRVPTEAMTDDLVRHYGKGPVAGKVTDGTVHFSEQRAGDRKRTLYYKERYESTKHPPLPSGSEYSATKVIFDHEGKALGFQMRVTRGSVVSDYILAIETVETLRKKEYAYQGEQPKLYNLRKLHRLQEEKALFFNLGFTPARFELSRDGKSAILLSDDGNLYVYDAHTWKENKFLNEISPAADFVLSGGKIYVAPSNETTIKVFDIKQGKIVQTYKGPGTNCVSLTRTSEKSSSLYMLCHSSGHSIVHRLNLTDGKTTQLSKPVGKEYHAIRVDRNEEYAYLKSRRVYTALFDIELRELRSDLKKSGPWTPEPGRLDDRVILGNVIYEGHFLDAVTWTEGRYVFHPTRPLVLSFKQLKSGRSKEKDEEINFNTIDVLSAGDYRPLAKLSCKAAITGDMFVVDGTNDRLICVSRKHKKISVVKLELDKIQNPVDFLFTDHSVRYASIDRIAKWELKIYKAVEKKITFRLMQSPAWMTIDENTGIIEWAPHARQGGLHEVVVEAIGPDGYASRLEMYVFVVPPISPLFKRDSKLHELNEQSFQWRHATQSFQHNKFFLYDSKRATIAIFDAAKRELLEEVPSFPEASFIICDGDFLYVGGRTQKKIQAIDIKKNKEAWRLDLPGEPKGAVALDRKGKTVLLISFGGALCQLDVESRKIEKVPDIVMGNMRLCKSADGTRVYVSGASRYRRENTIQLDTESLKPLESQPSARSISLVHPATGTAFGNGRMYSADLRGWAECEVGRMGSNIIAHPVLPLMFHVGAPESSKENPLVKITAYSSVTGRKLGEYVAPGRYSSTALVDVQRNEILLFTGLFCYSVSLDLGEFLPDVLVPESVLPMYVMPREEYAYVPSFSNSVHPVEVALVSGPEGMKYEREENRLTWTPQEKHSGRVFDVVIRATDFLGASALMKIPVRVPLKTTAFPANIFDPRITQSGRFIAGLNYAGDSLTIVSAESGKTLHEIKLGYKAGFLWLAGDRAYITNAERATGDKTLYDVIDIRQGTKLESIEAKGMTIVEGKYILPRWREGTVYCASTDGREVYGSVVDDKFKAILRHLGIRESLNTYVGHYVVDGGSVKLVDFAKTDSYGKLALNSEGILVGTTYKGAGRYARSGYPTHSDLLSTRDLSIKLGQRPRRVFCSSASPMLLTSGRLEVLVQDETGQYVGKSIDIDPGMIHALDGRYATALFTLDGKNVLICSSRRGQVVWVPANRISVADSKRTLLFKGRPVSEAERGCTFEFKPDLPTGSKLFIRSGPKGLKYDEEAKAIRWDVPEDAPRYVRVSLVAKSEKGEEDYLAFVLHIKPGKG